MKLPSSMHSQVNVRIVEMNRLYNFKSPVFKFLGERTNHSENDVWYGETSSPGDINVISYHLTAFELTNQLLYSNFPSLERIFKNLVTKCKSPFSGL